MNPESRLNELTARSSYNETYDDEWAGARITIPNGARWWVADDAAKGTRPSVGQNDGWVEAIVCGAIN